MPPGTADARTASAEQPATGASVTGHGAPRRDRRGPRPRACRSYAGVSRLRGQLPARAVAVLAPWPAAGPALAFLQLLLGPPNPALASRLLLGILNPADELVAGQGRDVPPGIERRGVGDQRLTQVCRQFMHHPTGHFLSAHRPMVWAGGQRFTIGGDVGARRHRPVLAPARLTVHARRSPRSSPADRRRPQPGRRSSLWPMGAWEATSFANDGGGRGGAAFHETPDGVARRRPARAARPGPRQRQHLRAVRAVGRRCPGPGMDGLHRRTAPTA